MNNQNKRDRVKEIKQEIVWHDKAIKNMNANHKNFEGSRLEASRKKAIQELLDTKAKLEKEKETLENANDYKWN